MGCRPCELVGITKHLYIPHRQTTRYEPLAVPRMYCFEIGDFNEYEALLFFRQNRSEGTPQRYYKFLKIKRQALNKGQKNAQIRSVSVYIAQADSPLRAVRCAVPRMYIF